MPDPEPQTGRRSACNEAARAAQAERLAAMTPLQRMALALRLGRRCRWVREAYLAGKAGLAETSRRSPGA